MLNRQMYRQTDRETNRWENKQMEGQTDGETNRWTDPSLPTVSLFLSLSFSCISLSSSPSTVSLFLSLSFSCISLSSSPSTVSLSCPTYPSPSLLLHYSLSSSPSTTSLFASSTLSSSALSSSPSIVSLSPSLSISFLSLSSFQLIYKQNKNSTSTISIKLFSP